MTDDRSERSPTPWRDLVAEFRARGSGSTETQQRVWGEIIARLDRTTPTPESTEPVATPSSHGRVAFGIGIILGIALALALLAAGVVP